MSAHVSGNHEHGDLVSVVVPVYNVEEYLSECLDSLLAQTYGNLEVILVDDGSTDSSSTICRKYADSDERFRVFRKENGGLSSARNYGISKATGEYLLYVDSDDVIANNMVEQMMRVLVERHVDVAVCGFKAFRNPSELACGGVPTAKFENMKAFDGLAYLYSERSSGCAAWAKLARIGDWRRVVFPEGRRFEDFPRIHSLFKDGLDVAITDEPLYYYRKRAGSITSFMSENVARELITSVEELCRLEDGTSGCLSKARAFKVALECTRLISKLSSDGSSVRDAACVLLKDHLRLALQAEYASVLQKLRMAIVCSSPDMGSRLSRQFMK